MNDILTLKQQLKTEIENKRKINKKIIECERLRLNLLGNDNADLRATYYEILIKVRDVLRLSYLELKSVQYKIIDLRALIGTAAAKVLEDKI